MLAAPLPALDRTTGGARQGPPGTLSVNPDAIPAELKQANCWVGWRWVWRDGRWTKPPFQVKGLPASSTNPAAWTSFDACYAAYLSGTFDGIGRVLIPEDGIVGGDLDHCVNPTTGEIDTWAAEVVVDVATYTERSPSGTGLRFLAKGTLPPHGRKKGAFEIYTDGRYLTFTGHRVEGTPPTIEPRGAEIDALHERVFGKPTDRGERRRQQAGPVDLDDIELIRRAKSAKNGGSFSQLWSGDWSRYSSQSEADLALVSSLLFWTGGDGEQADRLFRASGLMRSKWDADRGGETYGERTIATALVGLGDTYAPQVGLMHSPPVDVCNNPTSDPVERLARGLEDLGQSEEAQHVRACGRRGKRWRCKKNPNHLRRVKTLFCHVNCLCPTCGPVTLGDDLKVDLEKAPEVVDMIVMKATETAQLGELGYESRVRGRLTRLRRKAGIEGTGLSGVSLCWEDAPGGGRHMQARALLVVGAGESNKIMTRHYGFEVEGVLTERPRALVTPWLKSEYEPEARSWTTPAELASLLRAVRRRHRYDFFGLPKEPAPNGEPVRAARVGGGSGSKHRGSGPPPCLDCGGPTIEDGIVDMSETERREDGILVWRGPPGARVAA